MFIRADNLDSVRRVARIRVEIFYTGENLINIYCL